jgi:hypothetical protein
VKLCLIFLVGLSACASGGLKYTVDDNLLGQAPVIERQGMLEAQGELSAARGERQKLSSEMQENEKALAQAQGEQKQCDANCDKAALEQKQAGQGADISAANAANRNRLITEACSKVAEAKVVFLGKRQKALQAQLRAADRHIVAAQTKNELEKAKIAQAKGIKPSSDFQLSHFETQNEGAQQAWQAQKNEADALSTDADDAEKEWKDAEKRWQDLKGAQAV